MARKKRDKKVSPVIRILIGVILLFGVYHSLVMLSLCCFGETAAGVLDSYHSRRDDPGAGQNQSRTISMTYRFSAGGKEYRGNAYYSGDEAWPDLKAGEVRMAEIRYLAPLPWISKPAALTDYDEIGDWGIVYYFLRIPLCILLLLLVNGRLGKSRKKRRSKQREV